MINHMKGLFIKHFKKIESLSFLLSFCLAFYGFSYIRLVGLDSGIKAAILNQYAYHPMIPLMSSMWLFFLYQSLVRFKEQRSRFFTLQKWLLFNLSLLMAILLSQFTMRYLEVLSSREAILSTRQLLGSQLLIGIMIFSNFIFFLYELVWFVIKQVGLEKLCSFWLDRHSHPVEEERVFMFIDLNDSTEISKRLGPLTYSKFLNACFEELSLLQIRYGAEHYQYVGDEVVLTWKQEAAFRADFPCRLFFEFEAILADKEDFFLRNFRLIPKFKAALGAGKVSKTRIGGFKKELAYHGEVLSQVARIMGLCHPLQKRFLVGMDYARLFRADDSDLKLNFVQETVLKGFSSKIAIYEPIPGKGYLLDSKLQVFRKTST